MVVRVFGLKNRIGVWLKVWAGFGFCIIDGLGSLIYFLCFYFLGCIVSIVSFVLQRLHILETRVFYMCVSFATATAQLSGYDSISPLLGAQPLLASYVSQGR